MADDQPESGYGSQRRIDLFVQRVPTTETKRNHVNIPLALSSFAALLKAAVPVVILALIVWNWSYFATWLDSITHGELPGGFKFDRAAAAEKLRELKTNRDFNLQFADGVLIRAKFVLPALSGARVLWVDGEPSHNLLEQGILRDIGINVQLALATPEALNLARKVDFDLIISNLVRDGDITTPLERCGAVYFAFPNSDLSAKCRSDRFRQSHP